MIFPRFVLSKASQNWLSYNCDCNIVHEYCYVRLVSNDTYSIAIGIRQLSHQWFPLIIEDIPNNIAIIVPFIIEYVTSVNSF